MFVLKKAGTYGDRPHIISKELAEEYGVCEEYKTLLGQWWTLHGVSEYRHEQQMLVHLSTCETCIAAQVIAKMER